MATKNYLTTCERCQSLFETFRSEVARGRGRFCSVSCANSARRQTLEGGTARKRAARKTAQGRHKDRAREAVYRAIRRGELKRLVCEWCGDPKSEAHHSNYDMPLRVNWYCRKHHKVVDAELRRISTLLICT